MLLNNLFSLSACQHQPLPETAQESAEILLKQTFKKPSSEKFQLINKRVNEDKEEIYTFAFKDCQTIVIVDRKLHVDIGGITKNCDNYF